MPRSIALARVKGPYSERKGTRFRICICEAVGQRDLYFPTRQAALMGMKEAARQLATSAQGRSLGIILDAYIEHKGGQGLCGARSAGQHRAFLRACLRDSLADDIGKLTAKRAADLYEHMVKTPTRKTGQPPAAATHRLILKLAKALFRWTIGKGYLRESPFAGIQPVGRPNRGKKQLRGDEAERFITVAFQKFDQQQDAMALTAVPALLLGCRASEVLQLRVRDLDCGGTKQLHRIVRRLCATAGVPIVCPHSLRGVWETAGVRSGALSHAVAAALGHGSFAVTARHYVQPGALDGTRTERLVQILDLQSEKTASRPLNPSAEQLLTSLPSDTLARLLELAGRTLEHKEQRASAGGQ